MLQLSEGRHDEAISSARRAVTLNPSDAEAFLNFAVILAYSGETTEAVGFVERALRLSPLAPPGFRVLAGIAFALVAAATWAAYILLSAATGRRFPGSSGLVIAMLIAAALVTPPGVIAGGAALLRPGVLATGVAIGLLSSIIPYSLELEALRRIPPKVFGVLSWQL